MLKKIFLIIFLIFLFSSLLPNVLNYKNKIEFYQQIKKDYEEEKKKNIELKTKIINKKSIDEIEKTIRNKLNLSKENEVVIIIPSPTKKILPSPTPVLKNWQKWWQIFF